LRWSTVHRRIVAVKEFDAFLRGRQVGGPRLADHAAGVRALMLDLLGHCEAIILLRAIAASYRALTRYGPNRIRHIE
jgi:hypothetical protein